MLEEATITTEITPRVSELRRFRRVFLGRKLVLFGLVIILAYIIMAIFAPLLAHLLGTDPLGRDTLSRIIYGSQISLIIGVIVVCLAAFIGMGLGLIAGYFGGWVHAFIMRCIDSLMAFPMILLVMLLASLLGGGIVNVVIALAVGMIPIYCRLMCGLVLSVKQNDYILAERAMGAGSARIMLSHLVPNCLHPQPLGGVWLMSAVNIYFLTPFSPFHPE